MQPPVRFSARPDADIGPAPLLDQHGAEIRAEIAQHKAREKATRSAS